MILNISLYGLPQARSDTRGVNRLKYFIVRLPRGISRGLPLKYGRGAESGRDKATSRNVSPTRGPSLNLARTCRRRYLGSDFTWAGLNPRPATVSPF